MGSGVVFDCKVYLFDGGGSDDLERGNEVINLDQTELGWKKLLDCPDSSVPAAWYRSLLDCS